MFQSLARKATAAARPVKISGVERVSVSRSANWEPAAPLRTRANVPSGEAPLHIANNAATTRLTPRAAAGASTVTGSGAPVRGSSRMRLPLQAVARHYQPQTLDGDSGPRHRCRQATPMHHDD